MNAAKKTDQTTSSTIDFTLSENNIISLNVSNSNQQSSNSEIVHEKHIQPEVSLCRAIILQAIVDRMSNSKRTEERVAKNDATNWFDLKNNDFNLICELSGWSSDWVLKMTEDAIKNPERWRRNHNRYSISEFS